MIQLDRARQRMVNHQLRQRGVSDERLLAAMSTIPRERFLPDGLRSSAYDDRALPIDHGQTISQPFTVAVMCEALQLSGNENVLEIGTGSGYGAAVLSRLAHRVHSVERIPELAEQARHRLRQLGYDNVAVHVGDGTLGLEGERPFDGIIVTAGGRELPDAYIHQLSNKGRIVIPLGDQEHQIMWRYVRQTDGSLRRENLGHFAFVPLIGREGWTYLGSAN